MFDASSVYLHIMLVGMDGYLTQVMFLHIMLVGMDGCLMQVLFVFANYAVRNGWIVDLIIKKNQLYFCSPPNLVVVKYHELCLIG